MKVLVAGGAGYIGSHIVSDLTRKGHEVLVYDNLSTGHRGSVARKAKFCEGDLRDSKELRKVFSTNRIGAVMHFAASSLVGESVENPLKYYENNVSAFVTLLGAIREYEVKKIVFSSTAAVYGEPKRIPIREEDPKVPTNPYGRSKLMIEDMLADAARAHGIASVALRYFNAAGAYPDQGLGEDHDPETHLIPNILKTAKGEKKELVIFGSDYPTPDGTCIRDYIHVEDLSRAHLAALKRLEAGAAAGENEVFNLGSGRGFSVKEIVRETERTTGKKVRVKLGERRPGDPARLVASHKKARRILGWSPKKTLRDIIRSAWEWEKTLKEKK